jgi:hypothetical protein
MGFKVVLTLLATVIAVGELLIPLITSAMHAL